MLSKIKSAINKAREAGKININIDRFNDRVADITRWDALNTFSSNFTTHNLVDTDRISLAYKTSLSMKVFSGIFIITGIGIMIFIVTRLHGRWIPGTFDEVIGLLFSLFFCGIGVFFYYSISSPRLFDGRNRVFIKGRGNKQVKHYFQDIYAFQLIPSYITSSDGPDYYNYQLNIVLANGDRVHVMNYSKADIAHKDARIIAGFVGKKLWDAIQT